MTTIKPLLRLVRVDDADYFRARAIQEQIAAQKATCEAARKRHDELAAMYRFRALMVPDGLLSGPDPVRTRAFETVS